MKLFDLIPENELKEAVLSEYEKRLLLHKLKDEQMKKKYGMPFEEFEAKNIVKEKDFSWDVEKDSMEWEHAVESIKYLQEKIKQIKETNA